MAQPNVLLLDEPTNDLDIDTLQQLEDLLDNWAGTLVVISHDRFLIERICESTWALFGDKKLTNLPGGIEQYLKKLASGPAAVSAAPSTRSEGSAAKSPGGKGSGAQRDMEKALKKVERQVQRLVVKEKELHEKLATAGTDADRLIELGVELKSVVAEREAAEESWLELAEEVG